MVASRFLEKVCVCVCVYVSACVCGEGRHLVGRLHIM